MPLKPYIDTQEHRNVRQQLCFSENEMMCILMFCALVDNAVVRGDQKVILFLISFLIILCIEYAVT